MEGRSDDRPSTKSGHSASTQMLVEAMPVQIALSIPTVPLPSSTTSRSLL
jgi:hypothetical protein